MIHPLPFTESRPTVELFRDVVPFSLPRFHVDFDIVCPHLSFTFYLGPNTLFLNLNLPDSRLLATDRVPETKSGYRAKRSACKRHHVIGVLVMWFSFERTRDYGEILFYGEL